MLFTKITWVTFEMRPGTQENMSGLVNFGVSCTVHGYFEPSEPSSTMRDTVTRIKTSG